MSAKLQELTGEWRGERQRWGETVLGAVRELASAGAQAELELPGARDLTVKGPAGEGELERGLSYRFYGRFTEHPRYGRQFCFQTFVRSQPHGREGVIRYLQKAPHVGAAISLALWDKFGGDAVRILRERPQIAAAASRLTDEQAREAAAWLEREKDLEHCSIDLMDLLTGRGFPRATAKQAVAAWGNRAAEWIKRNPYALMRFKGCGFGRCDAIYLDLGLPPGRMKRQALCCWYVLARDTEGDTWKPVEFVVEGLRGKVGAADVDAVAALKLAKRGGLIATRRDESNRLWVAEAKRAGAEDRVAAYAAQALAEPNAWPDDIYLDGASEHQQVQLGAAMEAHLGLFNGSPGTGKTYTIAALVKSLVKMYGQESVAIACPTGKAAVRATEAMQAYGVPLRATTIHSLLKVAEKSEGEGWSFTHGADNPLPQRFLIVDEASMIDCGLMASLLSARGVGAHVLLVGDPGQLPPVGHGAPLRDLIRASIPRGELQEIRRNAGTIVEVCAAIRAQRSWQPDARVALPEKNLKLVEAANPAAQIEKVLACLRAAQADGLDPIWDCQVLAAVNARSPLARKALNEVLQRELNPGGARAGENPFRVGDKIVNTKNGFLPLDDGQRPGPEAVIGDDGKCFVANGELARVVRVEEKLTVAELSSPRRIVRIPRGGATSGAEGESEDATGTGCQWDLGYALSTHKSQGSEWPVVVVVLDEYAGARLVCSREWLYTAISRAKRLCFLVGKLQTAAGYCRREALGRRKTFLVERIAEARASLQPSVVSDKQLAEVDA